MKLKMNSNEINLIFVYLKQESAKSGKVYLKILFEQHVVLNWR